MGLGRIMLFDMLFVFVFCNAEATTTETEIPELTTEMPPTPLQKECSIYGLPEVWRNEFPVDNNTGDPDYIRFYDDNINLSNYTSDDFKAAFKSFETQLDEVEAKIDEGYKTDLNNLTDILAKMKELKQAMFALNNENLKEEELLSFIELQKNKDFLKETFEILKNPENGLMQALKKEKTGSDGKVKSCLATIDFIMKTFIGVIDFSSWACHLNYTIAWDQQRQIQAFQKKVEENTETIVAEYKESYWPGAVQEVLHKKFDGNSKSIANSVKEELVKLWTTDQFYIIVFTPQEPDYHAYSAIKNQFICENGARKAYPTVCVYRSKMAYLLKEDETTVLTGVVERYKYGFVWSDTWSLYNNTGQMYEELFDVGLVNLNSKEGTDDYEIQYTGKFAAGPGSLIYAKDYQNNEYPLLVAFP